MKKKISIIIPVYNVEKYIRECLESVISQAYENLEIILIDDGSNDKSADICREYSEKDSRIIFVHQDNKGVSAARNKGLELATGEYIGFVDSDDYIDREMYSTLVELLEQNGADIAACGYRRLLTDNRLVGVSDGTVSVYDGIEMFRSYVTEAKINPSVWSKLYKRELFDDIRFIEGIIFEDKDVVCRTLIKCQKGIFVNKALYTYRIIDGSLSHSEYTESSLHDYVYTIGRQLELTREKLGDSEYSFAAGNTYMILLDVYCQIYSKEGMKNARKYLAQEASKYVSQAKQYLNRHDDISKSDKRIISISFVSFGLYRNITVLEKKARRIFHK